jgi:hypothetical protein
LHVKGSFFNFFFKNWKSIKNLQLIFVQHNLYTHKITKLFLIVLYTFSNSEYYDWSFGCLLIQKNWSSHVIDNEREKIITHKYCIIILRLMSNIKQSVHARSLILSTSLQFRRPWHRRLLKTWNNLLRLVYAESLESDGCEYMTACVRVRVRVCEFTYCNCTKQILLDVNFTAAVTFSV